MLYNSKIDPIKKQVGIKLEKHLALLSISRGYTNLGVNASGTFCVATGELLNVLSSSRWSAAKDRVIFPPYRGYWTAEESDYIHDNWRSLKFTLGPKS